MGMAATISSSSTSSSTTAARDGNGKKIRKAYTITKSRESWTDEEHDKFIEALELFDRDWKKIEEFIGSKSVIQIRSHAQKYFLKVQKNGSTTAHVPPPRPKRKALHPYPHKTVPPHPTGISHPQHPNNNFHQADDDVSLGGFIAHNINATAPIPMIPIPGNHHHLDHALPDFAEVYGFIGSVFDPDTKDHLHKLKEMDPINFETVLLLMRNLTINLSSPDFEPIDRE